MFSLYFKIGQILKHFYVVVNDVMKQYQFSNSFADGEYSSYKYMKS